MNAADELIRLYAKQLKVPSFAEYQEVLRQAAPSDGFADLLLELMKAETASRQENQNRRRLKAAGFPYLKTMEEFDCSQLNDSVSPLFLQELASCQFIQNRQNVIMIGNPGRGKTHLAIALGLKACTQGYNVLFKNAATLSTELCEARDNYHLGKLERTLAKADLLILDEPVSGVDQNGLESFYQTVDELKRTNHMAILLVSHDLDVVRRYADRVVLMQGTVVRQGDPENVFDSDEFAQVFYTRGGHV